MGLFDKKKQDDVSKDWAGDGQSGLDFSSYELDAVGADIRSILDVPGAIGQAAKWALGIPVVVSIISWIVFSGRMSSWLAVPFVFVVFMLSLLGSTVIGAYMVTRGRLDTVSEASTRVVGVLNEMHADVVQVRDGHANTSVQQVAIGLFENALFPIVFGAVTATTGPLSFLSSRALKVPMNLVETSVIAAIKRLPDHQLGDIADSAAQSLPEVAETVSALHDTYQQARTQIEGIVEKVSRTALGSIIGLAAVASIPLAIWLILGWVVS